MNWIAITVLFLSVFLSAIVVVKVKIREQGLRLLLAFSGAYLLSVSFTHIIPNIFSGEGNVFLGYFVLLGFFIQLFLEFLSAGVSHGHEPHHDHGVSISPMPLLLGISLHAFFEGMPFAHEFHDHSHMQESLLLGIVIHKIPIAIILTSLFINAGYSIKKTMTYMIVFALASPMGSLLSSLGSEFIPIDSATYYKIIMALVVGIFLHISTTILFEADKNHQFNFKKILVIFVGVGIAILAKLL
ncbi:MAG: ZIP family metal transporter [Bacteroidales bacterium]|nr:ZIP family metal transporter [Bacteroidales bacterium]